MGVLDGLGLRIVPKSCSSGFCVPGYDESEKFATYTIGMQNEVETLPPD